MLIDRIVESNRSYVAGREARPLPSVEALELAVVACYDPRLDLLLLPALGVEPSRVFLFRTAGALVRPSGAALRSLGVAVFMFGVREVVVLGHTSCRMAAFESSRFIESFRERGVRREAFGSEDLRDWAGAIPSPRQGVQISLANLRAAAFLPDDLDVWGAVLDDTTGAIEIVARPGEVPRPAVPVDGGEEPDSARSGAAPPEGTASANAKPVPRPEAASKPAPPSASDEVEAAKGRRELVEAVENFVRTLRAQGKWTYETQRLRHELSRPINPLAKFRLLEGFARRAGADSAEIRRSFQRLEHAASAARAGLDPEELIRLFRSMVEKP